MNDFRMFDIYRKENTINNSKEPYCDVNHLLRFWREYKSQYLQGLFGDQLILEKQITYNKPNEELASDMHEILRRHWAFLENIVDKLAILMHVDSDWHENDNINEIVWRNLRASILSASYLADNTLDLGYDGYTDKDEPNYINSYTIDFGNGKKAQLQRGMKITRAFTQICKALNMQEEWEKFRIAHSQVLNTKKLTGTLCLSIHPLDYATASDNDNGWSSCMSWRENGCYRMGTVEMMNSPMVICAYLKSNKQFMHIDGKEWNSKKWRAWIIVTKDVIISNRHYPYHQDEMAINCIEWVKQLVKEKYGWEYEDVHTDFMSWMENKAHYCIEFRTNYMYNDIGGDDIIGCFRNGWKPRNMPGVINFSGPAECMVCGEYIAPEIQEAGQLECTNCYAEYRCSECGCVLSEDEVYYDPDGCILCRECYDEKYVTCDICEDTCSSRNSVITNFPLNYSNIDSEKYAEFKLMHINNNREPLDYNFDILMRHMPSYTEDKVICPDCAERYGIGYVDCLVTNNHKLYTCGPNPNKVTMNEWLGWINAPGYDNAQYVLNCIKHGHWFYKDCDEEHSKAYYEFIVDFWTKQWENYVNAFKDDCND